MNTVAWLGAGVLMISAACLAGPPDISKLNGSISLEANEEAGDISDVNGEIRIGDHCTVKEISSVNGSVDIGRNSSAASLSTVNGELQVGGGSHVSGDTRTVNGEVTLESAAEISGRVASVNGNIHLTAAHVGRGIETVWGDIDVGKDSRVDGGIVVRQPKGSYSSSPKRPPVIVVAPGATVTGAMTFEHEVKLYVSDRAKIGAVEGAKAIVYSGDRP
jgi:DUF4097 and DUF4098 domain-containing protein YvlB